MSRGVTRKTLYSFPEVFQAPYLYKIVQNILKYTRFSQVFVVSLFGALKYNSSCLGLYLEVPVCKYGLAPILKPKPKCFQSFFGKINVYFEENVLNTGYTVEFVEFWPCWCVEVQIYSVGINKRIYFWYPFANKRIFVYVILCCNCMWQACEFWGEM